MGVRGFGFLKFARVGVLGAWRIKRSVLFGGGVLGYTFWWASAGFPLNERVLVIVVLFIRAHACFG